MNSRIYAAVVLGGIAILAITLVLVFQFGRHDPSPPSLTDNPNPAIPGKILYVNHRQCVEVVEASGASREEVYCFGREMYFTRLYWRDANTFAYVQEKAPSPVIVEVDIRTGNVSEPTPISAPVYPGPPAVGPDGTEALGEEGGVIVLVSGGQRTEIADFDVPDYNWPQPMVWSPDGQWILIQYNPPRGGDAELWIIRRDGSMRGTLAKDALGWSGNSAWWIDGVGSWPELPK